MAKPYAILDADFISKLYSTKNNAGIPFIESLLEFDFDFCCHKQIFIELSRHDGNAKNWLLANSNRITIYKDSDVLNLFKAYPLPETVACRYYISHLKTSCDIYSQSYFSSCYGNLNTKINSFTDFLTELAAGDIAVGQKKNLGEVKNTVLMNALYLCSKNSVFKFCSDDQDTRSKVLAYAAKNNFDLRCISPFSFFYIAKNELAMSKDIVDEFFSSWISKNSNLRIKVIDVDNIKKTYDANIIYDDLWNEKVNCTAEGYIKY